MQRDTHSAVADAFAQHPSAMKMVVAAFTGHCGLGGFTTRLIKIYIVDGSLRVGVNRFALPGYLSWGLSLSGGDDSVLSSSLQIIPNWRGPADALRTELPSRET